jgi:hypothetical protein
MAIVAYTLSQAVHFADTTDNLGDTSGIAGDVVVLDTIANTGVVYRSGALIGTQFPFTAALAAKLVTAGYIAANATFSGVPGSKAPATGWTAVTGWTAGQFVSARAGLTSAASTQGATNNALLALISDLTAAGIIGA